MELKIVTWTDPTPPTEEQLKEILLEEQLKIYHWSNDPNEAYPGHTHGYHKIIYVVNGSINFEFPTRHRSVTLKAGDRLEVPAGIRHNAAVGADGVTCLEAHIY